MLSVNPKPSFYLICQIEDKSAPDTWYENPPNYPRGNFKTWAPTNPNREPLGQRNRFQNRGARNWQTGQQNNDGLGNSMNQRWPKNPQNNKRWNNRPMCNYCGRVGHLAFNCFRRRNEFSQPQNFMSLRRSK